MNQPLTIPQAEAVLTRAVGHEVKVFQDFHGYYARLDAGDYLPLYDRTVPVDHTAVVKVIPAVGDWPDVDLMECGVPAENEAADFAQRWNERRGA